VQSLVAANAAIWTTIRNSRLVEFYLPLKRNHRRVGTQDRTDLNWLRKSAEATGTDARFATCFALSVASYSAAEDFAKLQEV